MTFRLNPFPQGHISRFFHTLLSQFDELMAIDEMVFIPCKDDLPSFADIIFNEVVKLNEKKCNCAILLRYSDKLLIHKDITKDCAKFEKLIVNNPDIAVYQEAPAFIFNYSKAKLKAAQDETDPRPCKYEYIRFKLVKDKLAALRGNAAIFVCYRQAFMQLVQNKKLKNLQIQFPKSSGMADVSIGLAIAIATGFNSALEIFLSLSPLLVASFTSFIHFVTAIFFNFSQLKIRRPHHQFAWRTSFAEIGLAEIAFMNTGILGYLYSIIPGITDSSKLSADLKIATIATVSGTLITYLYAAWIQRDSQKSALQTSIITMIITFCTWNIAYLKPYIEAIILPSLQIITAMGLIFIVNLGVRLLARIGFSLAAQYKSKQSCVSLEHADVIGNKAV